MKSFIYLSALLIFCLGFSGCGTAPEVHFIIPEGFKGEITVISGEPCGISDYKFDPEVITLIIPKSGILVTQLPHNCDISHRKYFYKSESGQLTEISKMTKLEEMRNWTKTNNTQDAQRNEIGAYMEGCGFKVDNGYDSESVTIMTYNELQDSLASPFYAMRNFLNVKRELKKCQDSKP